MGNHFQERKVKDKNAIKVMMGELSDEAREELVKFWQLQLQQQRKRGACYNKWLLGTLFFWFVSILCMFYHSADPEGLPDCIFWILGVSFCVWHLGFIVWVCTLPNNN